jgi:GrpB-like predicted nucleotidyltransferase (UPF0157 family)
VTPELLPEAVEQLRLRYRIAASAADAYFDAGFTVAIDDVAAGHLLGDDRTLIRSRPCHVIVLLPSAEAIAEREAGREHKGYGGWSVAQLRAGFAEETARVGHWLDTTSLSVEETVDEILACTATAPEPVVVHDYDPAWPALFEELAAPIRSATGALGAEVVHVGSTAVAGLAAKPIVDVDVVVPSPKEVAPAIDRLRSLGYVYQGDKGIEGREAFLWPAGAVPHHVYVVVEGSRPHLEHVRFRDHLRSHPDVAAEYAALKRALAERHRDDRLGYTDAKTDFVTRVLAIVGAP